MGFITDGDNIGPLQAGDGGITRIHGTESQINVVENGREVTLSTPQDIAQDSQPVFRGVTLGAYPGANGSDAASVDYVINMISGAKPKGVVKAVMVTAAPMVGEQVIDTVTCSPGDRILRNVPDTPELNGIYDVQEAAWTRAINNDSWDEMPGAIVIASDGEAFGGSRWVCDAVDGGTIDVTANTWVMLRDPASVAEAPTDGRRYVRNSGAWEVMARALTAFWYTQVQPDTLLYYDEMSAGNVTPLTLTGRQLVGSVNAAQARMRMGAFHHNTLPLASHLDGIAGLGMDGVYYQNNPENATPENGYPASESGTLLVTYGQQEYTTTGAQPRKFVRGLLGVFNGSGPWGDWLEIGGGSASVSGAPRPVIIDTSGTYIPSPGTKSIIFEGVGGGGGLTSSGGALNIYGGSGGGGYMKVMTSPGVFDINIGSGSYLSNSNRETTIQERSRGYSLRVGGGKVSHRGFSAIPTETVIVEGGFGGEADRIRVTDPEAVIIASKAGRRGMPTALVINGDSQTETLGDGGDSFLGAGGCEAYQEPGYSTPNAGGGASGAVITGTYGGKSSSNGLVIAWEYS